MNRKPKTVDVDFENFLLTEKAIKAELDNSIDSADPFQIEKKYNLSVGVQAAFMVFINNQNLGAEFKKIYEGLIAWKN